MGASDNPGAVQPYLQVFLDDPSFAEPIWATLFDRGSKADLVWSRPKPQQGGSYWLMINVRKNGIWIEFSKTLSEPQPDIRSLHCLGSLTVDLVH